MKLELDADVTWYGFLSELSKRIATPVELVKLYNVKDTERRFNYQEYITENDKDKKLIDIAGLQGDGEYEFDLELPVASEPAKLTSIKALNRCSIIADGDMETIDLKNPAREYKVALKRTGWVRISQRTLLVTSFIQDIS